MGIRVYVYKNPLGDCTNNGISSKVIRLTVVNASGPFEPDENAPAVMLVKGPGNSLRLVPVDLIERNAWAMYGGNLGAASDSRWCEAIEALGFNMDAVKIFDRVE